MSRLALSVLALLIVFGGALMALRLLGVPDTVDAAPSARTAAGDAAAVDDAAVDDAVPGPILVELFTSQGCSSCPPADRLLSRLGEGEDPSIIPLAFHVDYWDYIGWKDPFSSKDWSKRQEGYARTMKTGRLYTPQLVVNGREHCVGSNRGDVERLIEAARRRGQGSRVHVEGELAADGSQLHVVVEARSSAAASEHDVDLWLAVVEDGLETAVQRGENAKKTLHNDHVVRRLEPLLQAKAGHAADFKHRQSLDLEPGWQAKNLRLVAFLQDRETLAIHGAGQWRPE